jgi:hypothetical protein
MAGVQIDGVNNKIDFDDDLDTSISANTDDTLVIEAGGNTMATITATTLTINDGTTITTADNTDNLTLKSTDTDANIGPNLRLYRAVAGAASDAIGTIDWAAQDVAGNLTDYASAAVTITDATDGSEDATLTLKVMNAGALNQMLTISGPETVVNEGSKDHDFRVESNGNTHMLFVDGGNDHINIGGSSDAGGLLNVFGKAVFKASDNSDNIELLTTDADGNVGPNLKMYRNSSSPADNDDIGIINFVGENDAGEEVNYAQIKSIIKDVTNGTEDGKLELFHVLNGALTPSLQITPTEIVLNESSNDLDFRVESNGDANMLFVNGGTDRVGIKTNAPTKTLGIGGDGIISLEGGSNALTFYDSSALKVYLTSQSFGDHNGDGLGLVTSGDEPHKFFTNGAERLRIEGNGKITTGGEAAGDVSDGGGLGLSQGGSDGNILTFKSSDIAHGMIDYDETDTYAAFKKYNGGEGGLGVTGYSESASPGINLYGAITTADTGTAHTDEAPVRVIGALRNGQAVTNFGANDNLFTIMNNTNNQVIVKGDGEIFSNQTATVGVFDTYEDAQLVRAYDLSQGKYKAGLIDSKFDKFVQYNAKDLADANLIGKEKDGTPNSFVNITGMQRLHNGAIWQQYEKHQKLAEAVYEMAKETLGADKADAILKKHDIKLLN